MECHAQPLGPLSLLIIVDKAHPMMWNGIQKLKNQHMQMSRKNTWLWRGVSSKNRKTTPGTTSATWVCQLLGSANMETTPQGTWAAAALRTQRPDAARKGKNEGLSGARNPADSCLRKHREAGGGRPGCEVEWAAKTVRRTLQQPTTGLRKRGKNTIRNTGRSS